MAVLVTGGAGFIGSAVCRHLIETTDDKVVNFDILTYASNLASLTSIENDPNYAFLRGDIRNRDLILQSLHDYKIHTILHLAAESHVDRSIDGPADFIETNIVGTYQLLEAAREYWSSTLKEAPDFRFLHVSTDEVFGDLPFDDSLFREDTAYDPSSPYSASKASSDHLVRAWHRTFGLPIVMTNCSNNYGPFHFPEKLIPLVILNALDGKPLPVYGTGDNVRDWLFVEDHARAIALVARRGRVGESYNVGGGAERTNLSVVETICDLIDQLRPQERSRRELITFVSDRPGHDRRYAIDFSKISTELGWAPKLSFEDGLKRTVEWYLENEWWWQPIRQNNYAGTRLGVSKQ